MKTCSTTTMLKAVGRLLEHMVWVIHGMEKAFNMKTV